MDLYVREATGDYRVARPREVLDSARDCVGQVFGKGRHIEKPAVAARLFAGKLAGLESERFAVLFLNQQHRVLAYEELFFGTIDASAVYPREVVKRALHHNAAAVILGHNHPSGNTAASEGDIRITRTLASALALMDITVLDHIIIGDGHTSMKENGLY
ncbi:MAG: JAB domain-containing protein [Candidatus Competibacter phosphatis]|jgi:DNA repair protein RadC